MRIVISSGHGLYVRGAVGYIDEVNEARKVVPKVAEFLAAAGHSVKTFNDDVSRSQNENLERIVNYHNSQQRDLDVSVHFNDSDGNTSKPLGTECYYGSPVDIAEQVTEEIAVASGLKDRGAKNGSGLYFIRHTTAPAILVEVCFVNSSKDCDLYRTHFDAICRGIASALIMGSGEPEPGPEPGGRPTISKGDTGSDVIYLQQQLNSDNNAGLATDGDFGPATDNAVRNYQASRRLSVDGIVGPATWEALETDAPPYVPPGLPPPMSDDLINEVTEIAESSPIATFSWSDRGRAPIGYTVGVALAFANSYRQLLIEYPPAVDMAKANTHNEDKDALSWYAGIFNNMGMPISQSGPGTLISLWTLLMGLGMRESSGKHCEGRDTSVPPGYYGPVSDTTEAGAWQTSWDAHGCSGDFSTLFDAYSAGGGNNPQGFLDAFEEGVSCTAAQWECLGSGNGYRHQQMSKEQPAYAAQVCAITLRNLRKHYGPINERAAEVVRAAWNMLSAVKEAVDEEEGDATGV